MWCALDGHPPVQILEPLHAGTRFHVYRALVGADEVCIKTPSPIAAREGLHRLQEVTITTVSTMVWITTAAACETSSGVLGRLLALEHAAIDATGGVWNHATLGLSHWLGPDGAPGLPALLLPLHDARPLARFERHERVDLIERMLPSLWDALSDRPHGDLNEANLLIARDRSKFHIIDPGVRERSETTEGSLQTPAGPVGEVRRDTFTTFITTPASYPILSPCDPGIGVSLVEELDEFSRYWRRLTRGLAGRMATPRGRRAERPWSPDLLAIGILYARALTGEEPFLGTLVDRPAWQGQLPTANDTGQFVANEVLETCERLRGTVAVRIDHLLDRRDISASRRRLARALLSLEIFDKTALLALLAG